TFDLAIEGAGFFRIETAEGPRLTRAGAFTRAADNTLVTLTGDAVLDDGDAPVFLPPDAREITFAPDGTISADGAPLARLGLWEAVSEDALERADGVSFRTTGELRPAENTRLVQGSLEASNVDPVAEMARMIEIQRAYELGQSFLEREDERMRAMVRTLGQNA
ncbi:MAG: flagellar basal body rod C-terminal domain-containing protein, partial [Pseudomonadota bacterium]